MRISVIGAPLFTLCVASLSWAQNPASMTPQAGTPPPPSVAPPVPATPAAAAAPPEVKPPQAATAPPSAAPTAGSAPAASAPSVAPATTSEPKAPAVVDWYQPRPGDPRLLPAPAPGTEHWRRHRDLTRMALYGMVDSHAFVLGRVSGVGTEIRVGWSGRYVGLTLGTYLPTADVSVGADFFRHSGWRVSGSGAQGLFLLAPTLEPRVFFSPRFDANAGERTIVAVGSSLFGLRLTHGHCLVDLRLPRVDGWVMPFTTRTSGAMSVGASLVLGYAF